MRKYTLEDAQNAYRQGWNHGHGIACHNVPTLGETVRTASMGRVTVDADNIREVHHDNCFAAADNSRQYSPFEFTAHEFNEAGEGGFRIHTADHDQDMESIVFETLEAAEQAALNDGYALIREYVWEASGYYVQCDDFRRGCLDILAAVYATRQEAMNAANSCGAVAVVEEVSSSDELWEAFEEGTTDAIFADLATYGDDDYGIDDSSDES